MRPVAPLLALLLSLSGCLESLPEEGAGDNGTAASDGQAASTRRLSPGGGALEPDEPGAGDPSSGGGPAPENGTTGGGVNSTEPENGTEPSGPTPRELYGAFEMDSLELNPPGADADAEWVYLCSNVTWSQDIVNWTLEARGPSGTSRHVFATRVFPYVGQNMTCGYLDLPGAFFPDQDVVVALLRPDGAEVQVTEALSDTADDDGAWVRQLDGTWEYQPASGT